MGLIELLALSIGLAMDAFAVSVCKGLAMEKLKLSSTCVVGLWFGGFQALMPFLGWLVGSRFSAYITSFDHWIAFVLLLIIGGNMIKEAFSKENDKANASLKFGEMLTMAVATSIDALAVGIAFACVEPCVFGGKVSPLFEIIFAVMLIGIITFAISVAGVKIGNVFGAKYKAKAEFVGGAVLILIGAKILLEHIGVLLF